MASRKHLVEVNRLVRRIDPGDRVLLGASVELARELARSMDANSGRVSPALATAYRAVLGDLWRVLPPVGGGCELGLNGLVTPVLEPEPVVNALEAFKAEKGIGAIKPT